MRELWKLEKSISHVFRALSWFTEKWASLEVLSRLISKQHSYFISQHDLRGIRCEWLSPLRWCEYMHETLTCWRRANKRTQLKWEIEKSSLVWRMWLVSLSYVKAKRMKKMFSWTSHFIWVRPTYRVDGVECVEKKEKKSSSNSRRLRHDIRLLRRPVNKNLCYFQNIVWNWKSHLSCSREFVTRQRECDILLKNREEKRKTKLIQQTYCEKWRNKEEFQLCNNKNKTAV